MCDGIRKRGPTLADIKEILPHRPPFLFVDHIVAFTAGQSIVTEKYVSHQEDYFRGHFPGRPIMPGVLISEALAQTCGILVGLTIKANDPNCNDMLPAFALTHMDLKFRQSVLPETRLVMQALLQKQFGGLYRFNVKATVNHETAAQGILSLGETRMPPKR